MKIKGKTLFYKKWYNHNIKYIADLINDDRWITCKEIYIKYKIKVNFLDLRGIISCMPNYWKHMVFTGTTIDFEGHKIEEYNFECKTMYKELLKYKIIIPEHYVTLRETNLETTIDEWD